ncbi:MAG: hypothetical protein ACKO01_09720 [Erythrobacter sp.]
MAPHISGRWRAALALLLPSLGGLAYLAAFGAPVRLIAVNAGALVLALAFALWGRLPARPEARLGLAAAAVGVLFLPLLTGPQVGGVARWLPAGPVQLHSGSLLLPLIAVIAAGAPRVGPVLLALAAAALALQPDAGALVGLAAAGAALASTQRSLAFALVAAAATALAVLTFHAGTLAPQVFSENVVPQVWLTAPLGAAVLGALVFGAAPLLLAASTPGRTEGVALAGLLAGLALAALLAPFPWPLIGYGASPILGLGLGLGAFLRAPR